VYNIYIYIRGVPAPFLEEMAMGIVFCWDKNDGYTTNLCKWRDMFSGISHAGSKRIATVEPRWEVPYDMG
jgi:hypothetical protein